MFHSVEPPVTLVAPCETVTVPVEYGACVMSTALRSAHGLLAYLFFATILAHLAAPLMHGLVRRDRVFAGTAP